MTTLDESRRATVGGGKRRGSVRRSWHHGIDGRPALVVDAAGAAHVATARRPGEDA